MQSTPVMPTHAEQQERDGGVHPRSADHVGAGVDRNGLEVLSNDECLRLMATQTICRVGLSIGALPAILPVNFVLHDDLVFIRAVEGRNLHGAMRNTVVALEVDHFDDVSRTGWSVLVRGTAYEVTRQEQIDIADANGLRSWVGELDRLIAVHARTVSGRRVVWGGS